MKKKSSLESIIKLGLGAVMSLQFGSCDPCGGECAEPPDPYVYVPNSSVESCSPSCFDDYNGRHCIAEINKMQFYQQADGDVYQHGDMLCWAASIAMVFDFYGHDVPQETIVQNVFGGLVNQSGNAVQVTSSLNRTWQDTEGEMFNVQGSTYNINLLTLSQELACNHPVIIGTRGTGSGHMMVLTSLSYSINPFSGQPLINAATAMDPWPGMGERLLSAQEWMGIDYAAKVRVQEIK